MRFSLALMRRSLKTKSIVSTLALLALLQVPEAWAAQKINVRGGIHDSSNRLVFDFPRTPKYDLKQDGEWVTLSFATDVDLQPASSMQKLSRLKDFEIHAEGDQTIAKFRVGPDAKVTNFLSGTYVVIDIDGDIPKSIVTKVKDVASQLDGLAKKSEDDKAGPKIIIGETVTPATNDAVSQSQTILGMLDVPVKMEQLPVSVFRRGDSAYIVFDRRVKIKQPAGALAVSLIDGGAFTGFRIAGLSTAIKPVVVRDNKEWQLVLRAATFGDSQTVLPKVEPHYALGARVLVPIASAAQIVSFVDPAIGDTLFVAPTIARTGMDKDRHFVDFDLLTSDQGIVVRPLNDKLALRSLDIGTEITAPNGIRLSDAEAVAPAVAEPAKPAEEAVIAPEIPVETPALTGAEHKLLFDLDRWKPMPREMFEDAKQRLQAVVIAAPADARNKARLDLARLYLANGYGKEARGMLDLMANEEEGGFQDLAGQPDFKALMGAAEMLSGNQAVAWPGLSNTQFDDYDDMRLWRAVSLTEQRKFADAAPLFDDTMDLLKIYPDPLFNRFALDAAETYIAMQNYPKATAMIDLLAGRTKGTALRLPQVKYLRGVLQSRTGTFDAARKLWEEVSESDDQLARTRARFALIDLNLATKTITPNEAAEQLERLRFSWRGDDLELQMLNRLGDIYVAAGQPEDALRVLDRAKNIFPEPERDAIVTDKQRQIFKDFFTGDKLKTYPPLKVLSLYNQYQGFMPTDPVERRTVSDRLVERMLAMDLLPQAAKVLEQRIIDESDPAAKAKIGAQLAGIRLLDRQPDAAIKALDATEAQFDADAATERKLLRARALADQQKYDAALALLDGDTSEAALRLKATTAWQAKQWANAAAALATLLPLPPATKMTSEQAQIVVNRAVALSLAGDQAGVTKLAADFGVAMRSTPQSGTFSILTDPEKAAGNLAGLGTQAKGVDLFQGFLESYRK